MKTFELNPYTNCAHWNAFSGADYEAYLDARFKFFPAENLYLPEKYRVLVNAYRLKKILWRTPIRREQPQPKGFLS